MLDSYARTPYQTFICEPIARRLEGISPNFVTLLSLGTGLLTLPLLALNFPVFALFAMLASGFLDTLDGTIARLFEQTTPRGTILDIVSDRAVESAIVIGLYLAGPGRGLPCLFMLAAILLCITSFLVVGIFSENQTNKSFYYSPGLVERCEAFIMFGAMMVLPRFFLPLALLFSGLVLATAIIRIRQFQSASML